MPLPSPPHDPESATTQTDPQDEDASLQEDNPSSSEASDASFYDRESTCTNCGAPRSGPYCAQCGQKNRNRIGPLRHLLAEVADELFSVDTRLVRTLKRLFFYPGALTTDYVQGRRVAYLRPFRLFVLSGVLLLLMTGLGRSLTDSRGTPMIKPMVQLPSKEAEIAEMRARATDVRSDDSFSALVHATLVDATANAAENPERINRIVQERLSVLAAVLLPAFAFLLYLLFPGRFYAEHVVHALHLHAFTFAVLSIYLAATYAVRMIDATVTSSYVIPFSALACLSSILVYGLLSFRRVYQVPFKTALWKGSLLLILNTIVFVGSFVVYVMGSLLLV